MRRKFTGAAAVLILAVCLGGCGYVKQEEYDAAVKERDAAQSGLETAESQLKEKEASLSEAEEALSGVRTELKEKGEELESCQTLLEKTEKERDTAKKELKDYKKKMKPFEEMTAAQAEAEKAKAEQEKREIEEAEAARKAEEEAAAAAKAAEEEAARQAEEAKGYETGITYDQLARTPDEYEGKKIKFSGKVLQVLEGSGIVHVRLAVNSDYDTILYCEYSQDIVTSRVLENDQITVYGTSLGLYSYESTMGAAITIPAVTVDRIDQ